METDNVLKAILVVFNLLQAGVLVFFIMRRSDAERDATYNAIIIDALKGDCDIRKRHELDLQRKAVDQEVVISRLEERIRQLRAIINTEHVNGPISQRFMEVDGTVSVSHIRPVTDEEDTRIIPRDPMPTLTQVSG